MSKLRAFLLHFSISATIVGTLLAIVFFIWYPRPFFEIGGAWNVVQILVGVDLILGPCLTLVVYKPNKPRLRFDMTVIAIVQLVALFYGSITIYGERPQYVVFVIDRYNVLAGQDLAGRKFDDSDWRKKPLIGPRLAVAELPEDVEEQQKLMFDIVFGAPDLEKRPELWHPFDEKKDTVLAKAKPISGLASAGPDVAARVSKLNSHYGSSYGDLVYVPVVGRSLQGFALVIDPVTARPLDIVNVDPWELPAGDQS